MSGYDSLLSRRALLKSLSSGFGYVAFAGLSTMASAAQRDGQEIAAGRKAAAFPGEGEASDLPLHARGAVARRHVRLQAAARGRYGQALAGGRLNGAKLLGSPWSFQPARPERPVDLRAFSRSRRSCRRNVRASRACTPTCPPIRRHF